ncbi:O-antigen polymerase [Croceicoccus sp. YJ47]|uniref:O-antigen polymerase n=1 Tax=Croceicoccus sp. YJ47 TaxID=2798724 RepID=UPI0019244D34|nr:O-antigen polymerase [Croceicoccus sp. YJ47]QQN72987.1 oligosaccharide repeat unit polymerase [Croceicoccus sp. YJ47]
MFTYDLLLGVNVAVFAVVAILYLRHASASLLHPGAIYLAFHGLIFVVRPILSRIYDYNFVYNLYEYMPSWSDRITVILAANLGFFCFMGTSLKIAGQPMEFRQDQFDFRQRDLLILPFLIVAALIGPIALYSTLSTWGTAASDASTMVRDATTKVMINTESNGYFYQIQTALASLTAIFAWLFRFRLWSLIPFGIFFLLSAGTGGRGTFVFGAILLTMLFLYDTHRRWPEWRSAVLAILVAAAFVTVVADRGKAVRSLFIDDSAEVYEETDNLAPLEGMDLANMEYFEFIVWAIPQRTGTYDYFLGNLQLFTEPIPRVLWEGKPAGAPVTLFNLFDYGNPIGMTASLPGGGWYSLGYIGVIIQCVLFALFYGWLYRILMRGKQSNLMVLTYCVVLANTIVTYRDGGLLTIVRQTSFYLLPVAGLWVMAKAYNIPSAQKLRQRWIDRMQARESGIVPETQMSPADRRKARAALAAGN